MSDQVRNSEDRFSHNEAQESSLIQDLDVVLRTSRMRLFRHVERRNGCFTVVHKLTEVGCTEEAKENIRQSVGE